MRKISDLSPLVRQALETAQARKPKPASKHSKRIRRAQQLARDMRSTAAYYITALSSALLIPTTKQQIDRAVDDWGIQYEASSSAARLVRKQAYRAGVFYGVPRTIHRLFQLPPMASTSREHETCAESDFERAFREIREYQQALLELGLEDE